MTQRLAKLASIIKQKNLDAFLITDPANIYYMSGFESDQASLLITENENFIITDFRYKEEAQAADGFKLKLIDSKYSYTVRRILRDLEIKNMGFEAEGLSYAKVNSIKQALGRARVRLEPLSGIIEELRLVKEEYEIKKIRETIAIAKKALSALRIKPGMSEKRLSQELDNLIRVYGGDRNAFETIVASGENASRPHAAVTNRLIKKDELVLIDFGVSLKMYNCDLTRVFILGKIKRILYDIYAICVEAQRRAIKLVRPGVKIKALDKVARDYITSKGFGKCFGHALGHGVGLSVHESPRISSKNNHVLKPNMIFTIEPGIYLEKVGGIRIEDIVLVTKKGCEVLTDDIPKRHQ